MKYNYNGREVDTNLGGYSFEKLKSGKWKLGFISDNNGLDDKSSDYYMDFSKKLGEETVTGRIFKNKLTLKLIDNTIVNKHIIHWVPSGDYFCITEDTFWDKLD